GDFTIDGFTGAESVTINGTNTNDTISVVKGATTTVQVNTFKAVSLPSASDESVTIDAGDGVDFIGVSGTSNNHQIVNVDGGGPELNNELAITLASAGGATVVPGSTPDAGTVLNVDGRTAFSGIQFVSLTGLA